MSPNKRLKTKVESIQNVFRVKLVQMAMRRPITITVLCMALALGAIASLFNMQFDIFPDLGTPQIFVVEPYGGLSPAQVESFLTYNFESQFFYVNGIEHIESKSIAQTSIIKLRFYPRNEHGFRDGRGGGLLQSCFKKHARRHPSALDPAFRQRVFACG